MPKTTITLLNSVSPQPLRKATLSLCIAILQEHVYDSLNCMTETAILHKALVKSAGVVMPRGNKNMLAESYQAKMESANEILMLQRYDCWPVNSRFYQLYIWLFFGNRGWRMTCVKKPRLLPSHLIARKWTAISRRCYYGG